MQRPLCHHFILRCSRTVGLTSEKSLLASPPRVDPRSLSLAQLHRLAERGSRRARAELEKRLRAQAALSTPEGQLPQSPVSRAGLPAASSPSEPPAAFAALSPKSAPATATPEADSTQALIHQLQLVEKQEQDRARADGPPRLVGLVLSAWGAMVGLGGLMMLSRGGGGYYLLCGVACAAVGALLMRRSRWAFAVHGVLALLALGWAWRGGSALLALVQSAPVVLAALWMALPAVREPLE